MKVGSLVVVKPLGCVLGNYNGIDVKWLPTDDEKTIYTVREIDPYHIAGAMFEEGIIGYDVKGIEIQVRLEYLKEVQPPISSEEIAELVEDACCVEKA